uniref:(northern house mosquito) hypothetical protein n=1 Tax=Culex pipiens TaxID=7175 RepID=A0A8D8ESZ0_CULPI
MMVVVVEEVPVVLPEPVMVLFWPCTTDTVNPGGASDCFASLMTSSELPFFAPVFSQSPFTDLPLLPFFTPPPPPPPPPLVCPNDDLGGVSLGKSTSSWLLPPR